MVNNWLGRIGFLAVIGGLVVASESMAQTPQPPAKQTIRQPPARRPPGTFTTDTNCTPSRGPFLGVTGTGYMPPLGMGGYPQPIPIPVPMPIPVPVPVPVPTPVAGTLAGLLPGQPSPLLGGYQGRPAAVAANKKQDKVPPPPATPVDKPDEAVRADDDLVGLKQALTSNDEDVRRKAASSLIGKGTAAVPALTEALRSRDKDVRRLAAETLEKMGASARGATLALTRVADKDDDEGVRDAARTALASIR